MSRQAHFHAALLANAASTPPGLRTCNGSDPAQRFAVYRNNVLSSLITALADSYPVVQALVGADFFRAMAREYVQTRPPSSPRLVEYGDDLASFIERFAPASALPYLADIARLEALRIRAYHAADATPLSAERLAAAVQGPQLAEWLPSLHPSLHVLTSPYAVYSLWAAHQGALHIGNVDPYRAEQLLVIRQGLDVLVIELAADHAAFIARLHAGLSLGAAAVSCPAGFDLGACLALLIHYGALVAPAHE